MSRVTIQLVKKVPVLENITFKNSTEIFNNIINYTNQSIKGYGDYTDLYELNSEIPLIKTKIFNLLKTEVEYYFNEIKHIPYLSDTLNRVQIIKEDFFIDIENIDNFKDSAKNIFIFFISPELELIENLGNKILVRNYNRVSNGFTFMIELNETVSIYSYSKLVQ